MHVRIPEAKILLKGPLMMFCCDFILSFFCESCNFVNSFWLQSNSGNMENYCRIYENYYFKSRNMCITQLEIKQFRNLPYGLECLLIYVLSFCQCFYLHLVSFGSRALWTWVEIEACTHYSLKWKSSISQNYFSSTRLTIRDLYVPTVPLSKKKKNAYELFNRFTWLIHFKESIIKNRFIKNCRGYSIQLMVDRLKIEV